jgi:hypothetical protein
MQLPNVTYALGATAIASLALCTPAYAQNVVTQQTNFTFAMVPTGSTEACIPTAKGRVTITHSPILVETMHVGPELGDAASDPCRPRPTLGKQGPPMNPAAHRIIPAVPRGIRLVKDEGQDGVGNEFHARPRFAASDIETQPYHALNLSGRLQTSLLFTSTRSQPATRRRLSAKT